MITDVKTIEVDLKEQGRRGGMRLNFFEVERGGSESDESIGREE